MNPMEIIQMIKGGQNPEQIAMNLIMMRMGNTPMGKNLMDLAKLGKTSDIEAIARNMAKQKGLDYDKEFAAFKENFGL